MQVFYRTNAGDVVSNTADDLSNTDGSSSIPSITGHLVIMCM